jgi:outer membrane receptor protein involved in Fe transport
MHKERNPLATAIWRALGVGMLAGAAISASPTLAQDEDVEDEAAAEGQAEDMTVDRMVVTGSRIISPNVTSPSPVTVVEGEQFDIRGTTDTIDLINELPQAYAAQTTAFANGANGTSTLDLRNLGALRTLVLVDGKRLPPGSPTPGGWAADVNNIPAQLVERVEIVTGGASAVYGSDAVAGVANFILRKNFEGVEVDVQYGFNQSNNDSGSIQQALVDAGIEPKDGSTTDNSTYDVSAILGADLGGGRGNVTAYFRYTRNHGVDQGERDFSQCALGEFGGDPFCLGSNQGPFPTTFVVGLERDADGNPIELLDPSGNSLGITSGAFSLQPDNSLEQGFTNAFNFNPLNPIRREVERYNAGFTGYYELADNVETYLDFGFMQNSSPQVIAPSAAFGSSINRVNCDNPLLSPELLAAICGVQDPATGQFSRDLDGDGYAQAEVRRRFVEGGGRTDDRTLTNFRVVGGVRGTSLEHWEWDVFGQFARTDLDRLQFNQVTFPNMQAALDIVADENGNLVCRSALNGTNPDCVPFLTAYDNSATNPPGLAAFVDTPTLTTGFTQQTVVGGTTQADLGNYGLASPMADAGVNVLFGFEYRKDALFTQADGTAQGGDLIGAGAAVLPSDGFTELWEGFMEASIPLVSGMPGVEDLTLSGAYRRSEYSSENNLTGEEGGEFGTNTFATGLSWTPVDDIRVRAQFQRAIRAPNILELFSPRNTNLTSLTDPCSGFAGSTEAPTASQEACANTGVTSAQYGAIPPDSGQLNVVTGGNPNLEPETADTITLGAVVQPAAIPGLIASIDYFNIDLEDAVGTVPPSFTLQTCLDTGNPVFCDLINRGTDGSLTQLPRDQAAITATDVNIGSLKTDGFDFAGNYILDIGEMGQASFDYKATYLLSFEETPVPGEGTYDCVGYFDRACGNPTFDYRHSLTTSWKTPWQIQASLIWRYYSEVERIDSIDTATGEITTFGDAGKGDLTTAQLEARNYLDFAMFWDATDNVTLRFGVNNLLDRDPPVLTTFGPSPTANVEANTVAGVYTASGRFIFAGANVRF